MESTSGLDRGWNFATNWTISAGSLGNSVTVESSSSPVDDDPTLSSAPKSPLVLSPPTSPDPGPCEITINFLQRYEVRQVYVRSTSRVYEIYYSPNQQGDNDYLCTVRCGVAAKDQAPDVSCSGESSSMCLRGSSEGLGEEKYKDDTSSSNDDEWVQVKSPSSPAVTDSSTSLLLKNYMNSDFYEATAEISDAEACVSLTIRLLSVQSVGCVYVDEVYVFVDRVDLNSESQECKEENSAGSSLLTMLVPSLLQLSKSKGASLLSEIGPSDSNSLWKQTRTGIEVTEQDNPSQESESTSSAKVDEQGVKSEVANAKPVHPVVEPAHQLSQNPYVEKMPDASYSRIETVLEQLVSRVRRMEDLFMRFEENMLKPISTIDARLQHVEQQLDALNERTLDCRDRSCKRFVAPEYSLSDSNINSLYGNESEHHDQGELEPDKKDFSDKLSVPPEDDKFDSGSSARMLPCLTVTAPDFSQGDDEEEEKCVVETEEVVDSPKVKRQGVSIDDALASSLAGFLSLAVRAPEFSNEDEDYEGNASPRVHFDATTDSSVCLNADDEVELYKNPSPGNVNSEDPLEKIDRESIDPREPSKEENSDEARDVIGDSAKPVIGSIGSHHSVSKNEDGATSTETSSIPVPDECEASDSLFQTQMVSSSHNVEELMNSTCIASEVPLEDFKENVLHDMFARYQSACMLDLATPIDVKFKPQENGTSKSVLEALLGISPESDIAIPSDEGTVEASSSQDHSNFIELDGANQSEPAANSCFTVDTEYYSLQDVLVDPDLEKLQDGRNQGSLAESLI